MSQMAHNKYKKPCFHYQLRDISTKLTLYITKAIVKRICYTEVKPVYQDN